MKAILFFLTILLFSCTESVQEANNDSGFVRGVCLKAPLSEISRFVSFIDKELAPMGVNVLVLRINYSLEWESHPELIISQVLKKSDALKIKSVCQKNNIRLVPLINCLGHQSWGTNYDALLTAYPEFEEDPGGKDQEDDFYCRSYCPLHPEVHGVLFDLFDETIELFESTALHVGMDEVFIIGEDSCKNGCAGQDKSRLFADEVIRLNDHLKNKGVKMWMWGDRLIDGEATGLGKWQASMNNTHRAIDMIPTSITICDWHYRKAPPTASMFASKGFDVVSCSHQFPKVGLTQLEAMIQAQESDDPDILGHMKGVVHTFWGNTSEFMDAFEGKDVSEKTKGAYETLIILSENW